MDGTVLKNGIGEDNVMNNFYTFDELQKMGFGYLGGTDILISKKCSIFRPENMTFGNHVRIDDFCLLSGHLTIGNYIHIAAYSAFFGGQSEVIMDDFSGLAYRTTIVAETDDYSGNFLTNPEVDVKYRSISREAVHIGKHVVLGAGSVVLPGIWIGEGCSFGAMSLVNKNTEPWGVYVGAPCRRIKDRSKNILKLEEEFLAGGERQ